MMKFDFAWGCILGFNGSQDLAEAILAFVRGITSEYHGITNLVQAKRMNTRYT